MEQQLGKEDGVTWERGGAGSIWMHLLVKRNGHNGVFSRPCRLGVFLGLAGSNFWDFFGTWNLTRRFDAWGNRRVSTTGRTGRIALEY